MALVNLKVVKAELVRFHTEKFIPNLALALQICPVSNLDQNSDQFL